MNKISSLFVILFVMFSTTQANAYSCGNAKVVIDHPRYTEVLNLAGALYDGEYHLIALSSSIMAGYSSNVRRFIFAHECGHYRMRGGSEIGADNHAIRSVKANGIKLTENDLRAICADVGPRRCENIRSKW